MKIYNMDDCTWYAAENVEDAIKAYIDDVGVDPQKDGFEVEELSAHELNTLLFNEDPYDHGFSRSRTFRKQLEIMEEENVDFPCFFATTEF